MNKKELYKQIKYVGCYIIQNKETGYIYIEESIDVFSSILQNISSLYLGNHICESLQEDFNKNKNINRYDIHPIYVYELKDENLLLAKHESLYIKTAIYLFYLNEHVKLFNEENLYRKLKGGHVICHDYSINNFKVLKMLYDDRCKIMDKVLHDSLKNDLKTQFPEYAWHSPLKDESHIHKMDSKKEEKIKLPSRSEVFRKFVDLGILPVAFSFSNINEVLISENIGYYDSEITTMNNKRVLVIKDKWIYEGYFVIDNPERKIKKYYVTEKGEQLLKEVLSKKSKEYYERT